LQFKARFLAKFALQIADEVQHAVAVNIRWFRRAAGEITHTRSRGMQPHFTNQVGAIGSAQTSCSEEVGEQSGPDNSNLAKRKNWRILS
jgi:hypothetical protein